MLEGSLVKGMKQNFIYILIIFLLVQCRNATNEKIDKHAFANTNYKAQPINGVLVNETNENLKHLLTTPIDINEFRRKKDFHDQSGSGKGNEFYFKPDTVGFYYCFFLFRKSEFYTGEEWMRICGEDGIQIMVYMFGDEISNYAKNETIVIKSRVNDPDLGDWNFVGQNINNIYQRFGVKFISYNGLIAYNHENKVLVFKEVNDKVIWFQFVKLREDIAIDDKLLKEFEIEYGKFKPMVILEN
ncbi:MAG: hypothetical protein K9H64_21670 [Bacteroidales bacterium]|nr:hypothetical protein [Bacteroidales bacterium]MCF8458649.1 hypothetical protein [Bacteroidales bacterium]